MDAEDERVSYMATTAVLDRSGVKPIDYDPAQDVTPPDLGPGRADVGRAGAAAGIVGEGDREGQAVGAHQSASAGRDRHGHQPAVASDAARHAATEMGVRPPYHPPYGGIAPVLLSSLTIQTNRRVLPATTLNGRSYAGDRRGMRLAPLPLHETDGCDP
jgi:hypothetical protein